MSQDFSHRTAEWVTNEIIRMNTWIRDFWWMAPHGWADQDTLDLLRKCRFDSQIGLSEGVKRCLLSSPSGSQTSQTGNLALGWITLGRLLDLTMKSHICVFAHDHSVSPATMPTFRTSWKPDELQLERLKTFFINNIWKNRRQVRWTRLIELVQRRMNFGRSDYLNDLGTLREFHVAVKNYLVFLHEFEVTLHC